MQQIAWTDLAIALVDHIDAVSDISKAGPPDGQKNGGVLAHDRNILTIVLDEASSG